MTDWVTSLLFVMIGVSVYSAIQHFLLWRQARSETVHLAFVFPCVATAGYMFGSVLAYSAETVGEYGVAVRVQGSTAHLVALTVIWFMAFYTRVKPTRILALCTFAFPILALVNAYMPFSLWYSDVIAVERHMLPWGELIAIPNVVAHPARMFNTLAVMSLFVFGGYCVTHQHARGERSEARFLAVALGILIVTFVVDLLNGYYHLLGVYLSEYGFLTLIIVMGHALAMKFRAQKVALDYRSALLAAQTDSSPDGILVVDAQGNWNFYNQRFAEMWGIADNLAEIPEDQATLQSVKSKVVDPDGVLDQVNSLNTGSSEKSHDEIQMSDGRVFERYSTPMVDPQGQDHGRVWFFRDATARMQLEHQLRQSQKMEAVGQLAGGVAHDFNNLLQVIAGYCALAIEDSNDTSIRSDLEEMMNATDRATVLVRQLLAFSHRQVLELEDLNPSNVVSELATMIRRVIGEHIAFKTHTAPGMRWIRGDRGQLEQVLMNLCVNARDAMPGGGTLTIETDETELDEESCSTDTWVDPGSYAVLSVTDTGCGMDEETQQRIFEPFFTTKEVGKGTGLGLATVFGIVRQHNGMIRVISEVGIGTTFTIYLPIIEHSEKADDVPETGPPKGGTETILVAEDDKSVRVLTELMLEEAGYTVLTAVDGEDAIRLINQLGKNIDLAILDVVMPKQGGKEVHAHIQQRHPNMRALFASGYCADSVHTDFVLVEGVHYLQKPYQKAALLHKVREVLDS